MAFPLSDEEHAKIKARIDGQPELIVSAAIRYKGWIFSVERPGRHGDCINFMHSLGLDYTDQGFLTNRGRFVDRKEAADIVTASGQTEPRDNCGGHLFSEDVWNDWDVTPRALIRPEDVF
jgi:hypothetical protein